MTLAEIHLGEDGSLGLSVFGGVGDVEKQVVAADLKRRGVDLLRLGFAPVPDGVEDGLAEAAKAFAAADAPIVFARGGKTFGAGFDLGGALLVEPFEAVERGEFAGQDVAQAGKVPDVEGGVVEQLGHDGPAGPVGFLAGFVGGDAEVFLKESGETDALAAEELGGQHGVEKTFGAETATVVQEAEIEIAAVHHEMKVGETVPKRVEIEAGCKGVHEVDFAIDVELEETKPDFVMKHVVRLGIEEDLVDAVEGGEERAERAGSVEKLVVGRAGRVMWGAMRRGGDRGCGGLDAEEAANGGRQ